MQNGIKTNFEVTGHGNVIESGLKMTGEQALILDC